MRDLKNRILNTGRRILKKEKPMKRAARREIGKKIKKKIQEKERTDAENIFKY
jgi:hypothetical protein